jgi:hypothetical protein
MSDDSDPKKLGIPLLPDDYKTVEEGEQLTISRNSNYKEGEQYRAWLIGHTTASVPVRVVENTETVTDDGVRYLCTLERIKETRH